MVYAFLRLHYGLDHKPALALVSHRVDVNGYPLFQYSAQNGELLQWLEASLGDSMSAVSGIMRWRAGGT